QGVLDRFGQIDPAVLVACDGYYYNGKPIPIAEKLREIAAKLPSVKRIVVVNYLGEADALAGSIPGAESWDRAVAGRSETQPRFRRLPFSHPLFILYSSGTTGVPKCIVHSAGGTLLKHIVEQRFHTDLKPQDRLFYFSTCGWMMWNWLVSGLSAGATLLLYDGSPFHPSGNILFDYADAERMTQFGTSAKYIDALSKAGLKPRETHRLSTVRAMLSTGSPLAPESFDYVYRDVKKDMHLASISGGTDIIGCFVLGNPMKAVWRGEIQGSALGMASDVVDENGRPVRAGKGELVCMKPFPSMPVGFWNDRDGKKYFNAYFARFQNIWHHGDFAEWTEHGGMIIHGRSDATLNPGGVRIGTSEIYRQVEQLPEIKESIVIGQDWQSDVRVVLFVVLQPGTKLDDALKDRIKRKIREGASPRHVPAKIVAVADIPRTKSGKITEIAVRDIVMGREVKNKDALANPEALDLYRSLPELSS
ncbi:MAG: acetoacetate--CoA ligase, partial [Hyphomicrobiaceae bacterium]